MSTAELEIRLKRLEKEVDALKGRLGQGAWWKQITGSFANDKAHDEAMALGRKYRTSRTNSKRTNGK
jgi:hypothetical protein